MATNVSSAVKTVWWMLLVRGILAVIFGVIALVSPGIALLALVFLFGIYAILEGIAAIVAGVRSRGGESHWGWQIVQGVVSVIAGVIALAWPGVTALALLFIVAFWAIVLGIAEVVQSFTARRDGSGTWGWALAAGVVNVIFGVVLLVWPVTGILALVWLVGIFMLIAGVATIVWAFRARSAVQEMAGGAPAA
ncbi:hypothetical protein BJF78_08860 [Pseudonocardia sp. CNS-139]|nr:hypothetical protein BJF78_08860 [Pseudonocardia sp. CNS-139]